MIGKIGNKICNITQNAAKKASAFASEAPRLKQPLVIDVYIKSDGIPSLLSFFILLNFLSKYLV